LRPDAHAALALDRLDQDRATLYLENASSNDATSLNSKCSAKPFTCQQASGPWYLGCAVALIVAMVRPWKEP
jgi:hypothetical protein